MENAVQNQPPKPIKKHFYKNKKIIFGIILTVLVLAIAGTVNRLYLNKMTYEECAQKQPESTIKPENDKITCTYKGKSYTKTLPKTELSKSQVYKDEYISFQYPESWKIVREGTINTKITYNVVAENEESVVDPSNDKVKLLGLTKLELSKISSSESISCNGCEVLESQKSKTYKPEINYWMVFARDPVVFSGIRAMVNKDDIQKTQKDFKTFLLSPKYRITADQTITIIRKNDDNGSTQTKLEPMHDLDQYKASAQYRGFAEIMNSLVIN